MGNALDLSEFEDGSFGAVVAFEMIEHVNEQERVLAEVARVLADDGMLIISTPDRRLYSDATGQVNPFHQHELTYEEFSALLGGQFPHVAVWGQRTITGSHLAALGESPRGRSSSATEFFIERAGDEWRMASEPAALYLRGLGIEGRAAGRCRPRRRSPIAISNSLGLRKGTREAAEAIARRTRRRRRARAGMPECTMERERE